MPNVSEASRPDSRTRWETASRVLFWLTAGSALLAACWSCIARPDLLAALTLIPAWLWLLPGLMSVAWAMRFRQRRTALVLIGLWAIFAIGWVEEFASVSRSMARSLWVSSPTGQRIRIVSMNCANTARCVDDLAQVRPDLVLLQESPGIDGLQRMTQQLFGGDGHFLSGGDTAILARGPIEERFVDLAGHFVVGTVTLPNQEPIQCVSLRLTPPVTRLDFWTTEFWLEHREMRNIHRRELQEVVQEVRAADASSKWVVGGDFNTTPHDRALSELRPLMTDSFMPSGTGLGGTGTNDWPLFRVDQVWVNARSETERVCAVKSIHSDHRLVVCDLKIED